MPECTTNANSPLPPPIHQLHSTNECSTWSRSAHRVTARALTLPSPLPEPTSASAPDHIIRLD
eukprot:12433096-Alexandrium_andersonii.AAC.1